MSLAAEESLCSCPVVIPTEWEKVRGMGKARLSQV